MRAALALLAGLLLLGCEEETLSSAPPRTFAVALHDPGANQNSTRSQPAGQHVWSGVSTDTVYVQMTAPVTATATVTTAANSDGGTPDEVVVWLDGAGELGDGGLRLTSTALEYENEVLPSTFDVLVAPDGLLGRFPMRLITPVTFSRTSGQLLWELDELERVEGRVVTWQVGAPVEGAIVSVYRASEPRYPMGVTVVTDSTGTFAFDVPEGRYDLVVSSPSDGSRAIPTVRVQDQDLPLFEGLQLRVEVPTVPVVPVRGQVIIAGSDVPTAARVRLVGQLTDLVPGGTGIRMGRHRVEIETEADGTFELELPLGTYEIEAYPRFNAANPTLAIGRTTVEVPFGVPSVDGVEVAMPPTSLVRIEAKRPDGTPLGGATVNLRMQSPPRYAWRYETDAEGVFVGPVIPDTYDIELVPPLSTRGQQSLAREHAEVALGTGGTSLVTLQTRRSDRLQGLVFTQGEQPVFDVLVEVRDPETGELWDVGTTRTDERAFQGVFEAVVPR